MILTKFHQKSIALCITIICTVCLFSGCSNKKTANHNIANNNTVTSKTAKASKPKPKSSSKSISKASAKSKANTVSITKDVKINAVQRTKVDYKKLLPANYKWNIIKTADVNLGTNFTIVAACSDRYSMPMIGQFFIFSKESKLLWKSSEFETSSILNEKIHVLKLNNKALIYGEYVWGGARGMMYGGITFGINPYKGIKELNKDILVGLNGETDITNNSIVIEGECIKGNLVLSMPDGIYKEQLINGATKVYGINEANTINDIEHWNHPVKKLLEGYGIGIDEVELLNNKTYPIFNLGYTDGLLDECYYSDLWNIAEANGFWNYKLCSDDSYDENKSVEVFCDRSKRILIKAVIYEKEQDGSKSLNKVETDRYFVNKYTRNTLKDNDFKVKIGNVEVSKQSGLAEIVRKYGTGSADESNNAGYIGRTPDGHQRRRYGYPKNNPIYNLIILDDQELERIDVNLTIKGLHIGDSYNKMINQYGKPSFEILRGRDRVSEYVYSYKDMQFQVLIYNNKVNNISIQYQNLYRF
jgi:hypothetical protein